MSVRTKLVQALAEALPASKYRVTGSPACPEQIEAKRFEVRAWASKIGPAGQSGASQVDVVVWVLTAKQKPGEADDALDVACDDVLGVLYGLDWLNSPTAERGVMDDNDGPRWHGWRFEASAYARIETTED